MFISFYLFDCFYTGLAGWQTVMSFFFYCYNTFKCFLICTIKDFHFIKNKVMDFDLYEATLINGFSLMGLLFDLKVQ